VELDLKVLKEAGKASKFMQQLLTVAQSDWTKAMGVGAEELQGTVPTQDSPLRVRS